MPDALAEDQRKRKLKRIKEHVEKEFYDVPISERKSLVRATINFLLDVL